jgi:hypothetical protein
VKRRGEGPETLLVTLPVQVPVSEAADGALGDEPPQAASPDRMKTAISFFNVDSKGATQGVSVVRASSF